MNLESRINNAKCCVAEYAQKYVRKKTYGEDTEEDFSTLSLLNGYVEALSRYDCDSYKKVVVSAVASEGGVVLTDGDAFIQIDEVCVDRSLFLNDTNCLSEIQVCSILEQVQLMCNNCNCNC
jgi:hypothetical protein